MKLTAGKIYFLCSFLLAGIMPSFAQLNVQPANIKFENRFSRLESVKFFNTGIDSLSIDSINYNKSLYTLLFNGHNSYPVKIAPADSVEMDCILSGYFQVSSNEVEDSIAVNYNSGSVYNMHIEIDFFEDTVETGSVTGNITSSADNTPQDSVNVDFYYKGIYFFASTTTNSIGNYSITLPKGSYSVSAQKPGYRLNFYNGKNNPMEADQVDITKSGAKINLSLTPAAPDSNISISGLLLDAASRARIGRGIVVIRKGLHTPRKAFGTSQTTDSIFAATVNPDGTFKVDNLPPNYYYTVQGFSDFYSPSYFKDADSSSVYWQEARDSLYSQNASGINIYMPRDSSVGGGIISGKIVDSANSISNLADIIVYAQSVENNQPSNYAFVDAAGNYSLSELKYGTYNIFAQKVGIQNDAVDSSATIGLKDTVITNRNLIFPGQTTATSGGHILPNTFSLSQNYPNPFNPTTTIQYRLPLTAHVTLDIYNIIGQRVKRLVDAEQPAGSYSVQFGGRNLASGVYLYRIQAGSFSDIKKMILLK